MDIKQLEYFTKVAENGSFSRAAMALDIAQSALSRQVRALEVELRETLLIRNGRGVALTEAGHRLHAHAVVVLQQMEEARNEMRAIKGEPVGRIAMGFPPSVARALTVPLVAQFKASLPQAKLAIVEGLSTHMVEWLLAGRLDLAVLYNPDPCPELEFVPLFSESLCLIGPAVPTQLGKVVPPGQTVAFEDLVGLPMILPGPTHVIRRLLDRHATLQGVPLTVALEISSIQAIIDLVCGGHGFAVLPRSTILHSGRQGDMQVNSLSASAPEVVLSLAQALNKRTTPLSKAASTIVKDLLLQTLQA